MNENKEFKPYVPAEKITPEFTLTSIIMGIILAIVFGAANAYLGLRVGMTVSASIPAAVISMGVIRVLMKKNSILESNMVQTTGSAGESLAVRRRPGRPVSDSASQCSDRKRTCDASLSGRNGLCGGSSGRRGRRSQCFYRIQRHGACSALQTCGGRYQSDSGRCGGRIQSF